MLSIMNRTIDLNQSNSISRTQMVVLVHNAQSALGFSWGLLEAMRDVRAMRAILAQFSNSLKRQEVVA